MQGTDGQAWKSYFTRVIALHKAFLFKKKIRGKYSLLIW